MKTQEIQKHTPTPWTYREDIGGVYAHSKQGPQDGKARTLIADTTDGQTWNGGSLPIDEREANGRLIVEACNSHAHLTAQNAVLVEALEALEAMLKELDWCGAINRSELRAREALKAAKGQDRTNSP